MLTVGTGIYHAADAVEAVRTLLSGTAGPADAAARGRLRAFLEVPSRDPRDDAARRARLEELRAAQDIPRRVWIRCTARGSTAGTRSKTAQWYKSTIQRWRRSIASWRASSGPAAAARTFRSTLRVERMPGMTALAAGWLRQNRSATPRAARPARRGRLRSPARAPRPRACARRRSSGSGSRPRGTSSRAGREPVSAPSSNGTRTITPTRAASTAGKSASSGLWSKTL